MRLKPHPANPPTFAHQVEASVARRSATELSLQYRLLGDLNLLMLSRSKRERDRLRTDDLWRTTCFEAFLRRAGDDAYVELNLSPCGDWAAYRFDSRRTGMTGADVATTDFAAKGVDGGCRIGAWFEIPELATAPGAWTLGLSAVVESIGGTKSYWALAHAPGPPDFHNPACFTATLPPPARA